MTYILATCYCTVPHAGKRAGSGPNGGSKVLYCTVAGSAAYAIPAAAAAALGRCDCYNTTVHNTVVEGGPAVQMRHSLLVQPSTVDGGNSGLPRFSLVTQHDATRCDATRQHVYCAVIAFLGLQFTHNVQ